MGVPYRQDAPVPTLTLRTRRRRHRRTPLLPVLGCAALLSLLPAAAPAPQPAPPPASDQRVSAYLKAVEDRPAALRAFFRDLPKGADLHNHLSGAASTELLIRLAGEDGLCVDERTLTARPAPCGRHTRPAAQARTDAGFRRRILRAWSMQDFPPGESGHDHFFGAFDKFRAVSDAHIGRLLAEVADTAARNHQFYLETMVAPAATGSEQLAADVGFHPDLARLHRLLLADGKLDRLVRRAERETDAALTEFRAAGECGTGHPHPGCRLPFRFIYQASRGSSPERVFTQLALGMRLAERDPRFVAVNLVQPEDGANALRDYRLQMRMLNYLHGVYPRAHITLHAGELTAGLVGPSDLRFHIGEAVRTGRAERIGHGVDVAHEDHAAALLRTMARRGIAVEVPLTSNRQILGVHGAEHPFPLYRRYGVPVVLSTDDPGISRTDIGEEYRYAARTYRLDYRELKDLARASLDHAFLPGDSLWDTGRDGARAFTPAGPCRGERPGTRAPRQSCAHFLANSPKATLEWRQEAAFTRFAEHIRHLAP
ncbi:adenosine deaminase family protein [Streptomyces celluloflavus]|uniref:adenosine deaminase family protein n=1 Tax=Streptomyces celluloflavus TaxID=58344 RepID=UPI0036B97427